LGFDIFSFFLPFLFTFVNLRSEKTPDLGRAAEQKSKANGIRRANAHWRLRLLEYYKLSRVRGVYSLHTMDKKNALVATGV